MGSEAAESEVALTELRGDEWLAGVAGQGGITAHDIDEWPSELPHPVGHGFDISADGEDADVADL
jgi:hypothetical protein